MFKISEFSKLSQISAKTLRYYDRIGLLKPSQIDPDTGYRYYSASQLQRVNHIYTLKDLGFKLEQIIPMLDSEISADQIRSMLLHKQEETKARLEEEQARLMRIQSRLRQVEQQADHTLDMTFKHLESRWIASIRQVTSKAKATDLWEELRLFASQHALPEPQTWMVLWHSCAECEDFVDLEVAIPLDKEVPHTERVQVRLLEETNAACIVHDCHPHGLCGASSQLGLFLEANGKRVRSDQPSREIYLEKLDGGRFLAEMQMPVSDQVEEGEG